MNRTHRSLWNSALGAWVAAPENASARGKPSGRHAAEHGGRHHLA
ncbi:ESPR domain-containing protein [Variovorax sp. WS11]